MLEIHHYETPIGIPRPAALSLGCCFTGHRDVPLSDAGIDLALDHLVEELVNSDVRQFYEGGAYGFDYLAALSVIRAKERHPERVLRLNIVKPFQNFRFSRLPDWQRRLELLDGLADRVIIVSEHNGPRAFQIRNEFMVDRSLFCVCYCTHTGGTRNTVRYAKQLGRTVYNIADGGY